MAKRKNPVFFIQGGNRSRVRRSEGLQKKGKSCIQFFFSMERSANAKGGIQKMLYQCLSLSNHPFLSLSLPLCLLPGDSSNGGRVKRKRGERGEKWRGKACFSPWAKQSRTRGLSLRKFFLFANHPFSVSVYPFSWDQGGLN